MDKNFRILSNYDIIEIADVFGIDDLIFVGTQDLLRLVPKSKRKNKFYIINLDKLPENGGTGMGNHWVMLSTHDDQPFYFDSYGMPPPQRVHNFVKSKSLAYWDEQIQSPMSEICGWYCLMVCHMMDRYYKKGKSFNQFITAFKRLGWNFGNEKNNYRIVLKYFSNAM